MKSEWTLSNFRRDESPYGVFWEYALFNKKVCINYDNRWLPHYSFDIIFLGDDAHGDHVIKTKNGKFYTV